LVAFHPPLFSPPSGVEALLEVVIFPIPPLFPGDGSPSSPSLFCSKLSQICFPSFFFSKKMDLPPPSSPFPPPLAPGRKNRGGTLPSFFFSGRVVLVSPPPPPHPPRGFLSFFKGVPRRLLNRFRPSPSPFSLSANVSRLTAFLPFPAAETALQTPFLSPPFSLYKGKVPFSPLFFFLPPPQHRYALGIAALVSFFPLSSDRGENHFVGSLCDGRVLFFLSPGPWELEGSSSLPFFSSLFAVRRRAGTFFDRGKAIVPPPFFFFPPATDWVTSFPPFS